MKFFSLVFLLLMVSIQVKAQKENNVWVGGGWTALDFNSGQVQVFSRDSALWVDVTNASICDKNGNLLFYTNGYRVYDSTFHLMQNGNQLEIGDYESWGYGFNTVPDGAGILPIPGDSNRYYIFHMDLNYVTDELLTNALLPAHLFYSVVDMTLNSGKGAVVTGQKNIPVLSDTLTSCGFKMVKHANGRDYWLLCHEYNSDNYYRFLIDPYGMHGPYSQHIGYVFKGLNALGFSTLHFDEQAAKAAQLSVDSTAFKLMDFDRCSGEFSNVRTVKVSDSLYQIEGAAFSPNGQLLYISANHKNYIWQFDVTAVDIFASRQLVAHYNGAMNPFETNFYQLRLAPDNKIYVHAYDYMKSLHVINFPDSSGTACGFVANGLQINPPGYNWQGFPNLVNYHLGPIAGSVCDSLVSVADLKPNLTWSVYPNPTSDNFQLSATGVNSDCTLTISNVLGQIMHCQTLTPHNHFIHHAVDVSEFSAGVYLISLDANGSRFTRKIVVN